MGEKRVKELVTEEIKLGSFGTKKRKRKQTRELDKNTSTASVFSTQWT